MSGEPVCSAISTTGRNVVDTSGSSVEPVASNLRLGDKGQGRNAPVLLYFGFHLVVMMSRPPLLNGVAWRFAFAIALLVLALACVYAFAVLFSPGGSS